MELSSTQQIGSFSEQQACRFLEAKGLRLLTQNYRCMSGEIDLIMQHGNDVVFVEVRTRNHKGYGNPFESVNFAKQRKLHKTATHFLQKQNWIDKVDCRFDIIGISNGQIEWIQNAFSIESF
jgi:putative endonuclease